MFDVPAVGGPPGVVLGLVGAPTELCVLGCPELVLPMPIPVPVPVALPVGVLTLLLPTSFGPEPVVPMPVLCELNPPAPVDPVTPEPVTGTLPAVPPVPVPAAPPVPPAAVPPAPPAPAAPPSPPAPAAMEEDIGATARASIKAQAHVLFNISDPFFVPRGSATTSPQRTWLPIRLSAAEVASR